MYQHRKRPPRSPLHPLGHSGPVPPMALDYGHGHSTQVPKVGGERSHPLMRRLKEQPKPQT